jgi:hypothetical protein
VNGVRLKFVPEDLYASLLDRSYLRVYRPEQRNVCRNVEEIMIASGVLLIRGNPIAVNKCIMS